MRLPGAVPHYTFEEMLGGFVKPMDLCREASRLLGIYLRELCVFHDERGRYSPSLASETPIRSRQAALETALQARRRYWNHVQSHGCRETTDDESRSRSLSRAMP